MASVHMYSPRKTSLISTVPFIVVSFFTDSSISVMVHGQPLSLYRTFVCLRHLAVYRLSFSPWRHLGLLCPHHFYLSQTSNHVWLTSGRAKTATHINTCDSMGGSVPTVEMITVELVQAYITRGVVVSLLCQSKNSEVLNTFHPNSGGGLTMPLEKVWRNTWCVNSSGWLYCKSLCV